MLGTSNLRYLLLQIRDPDDPIREQEVRCFRRALACSPDQIRTINLIHDRIAPEQLQSADVVLIGGSGDYSVVRGGAWLDHALHVVAHLHQWKKPTFASCWGFQAMARALGGEVVTDVNRAELGTFEIYLSEHGRRDPVFQAFSPSFLALEGHQDIVTRIPEGAQLLATSGSGIYQAFTFPDMPIYCTQFHPELDLENYLQRVRQYPQYLQDVYGISVEAFAARCRNTPQANQLLRRFVDSIIGHRGE